MKKKRYTVLKQQKGEQQVCINIFDISNERKQEYMDKEGIYVLILRASEETVPHCKNNRSTRVLSKYKISAKEKIGKQKIEKG